MLRLLLLPLLLIPAAVLADDPLVDRPVVVAKLVNSTDIRKKLSLLPDYTVAPRIGNVKVAVLDAGFAGFDGKRPYLPANTVLVENYDREFVHRTKLGDPDFIKPLNPADAHGRMMAQLVWAMTGNSPEGPQFYLLNANGPTMFRRAVRYAIEQKVDIILFSSTFEGAGNYDGRGPVNAAVDDAVRAGIIWINAAGNSGGQVFNGPVQVQPDGYLRFRGTPFASSLRFTNRFDENAVTITLTWNDYRDTEDAGTEKDLDLIVQDTKSNVVGSSALKQIAAGKGGDGETKNPRERVVLTDLPAVLPGQEYRIRVKAKSGNFGPTDRLRIQVSSQRNVPFTDPATGKLTDPVEFLDATPGREIYPPADHPSVLTVGDTSRSSSVGPTEDGRVKPDVIIEESLARFSNGEETSGSSNAAAYFAGVAALLKAQEPRLTSAHLRAWVKLLDTSPAVRLGPAPPQLVSAPPPPAGVVPLSPNEARALNTAQKMTEEPFRPRGGIVISGPNRTIVIPAGQRVLPALAPPTVRAQAPTQEPVRKQAVHTPWATPGVKALAELVRER
jgi:hypothetical protein